MPRWAAFDILSKLFAQTFVSEYSGKLRYHLQIKYQKTFSMFAVYFHCKLLVNSVLCVKCDIFILDRNAKLDAVN